MTNLNIQLSIAKFYVAQGPDPTDCLHCTTEALSRLWIELILRTLLNQIHLGQHEGLYMPDYTCPFWNWLQQNSCIAGSYSNYL